jgi:predicted lipoprotein with Yx(FWY)xxD motif
MIQPPSDPDALLETLSSPRRRRSRAVGSLGVLFLASLILAACSSSPSNSSGSATTSGGSGSTAPIVTTANNTKYGTILVSSDGKTLYTLVANGHPAPCINSCGHVWPPLLVPAGSATLKGGNDVTGLGKSGSGTVVTYQDYPLFMYAGDTAPGQANGNGISSYGGTWYVIKVGEKPGTPVSG